MVSAVGLRLCFVLPASRHIQVDSPYEISRAPDELHYTYLDTFGRPVIVAYKKNLVEQHIQDIVVSSATALPLASSSPEYGVRGGQDLACLYPSLFGLEGFERSPLWGQASESMQTRAGRSPSLSALGPLHVQQGAHAAGATAGGGRFLHLVLHRHRLRQARLLHHKGTPWLFACIR